MMVVMLMRLLPGLVSRLAMLHVGVARLAIMGIGGLGRLMAAAVAGHRRSGRDGERGTGQEERGRSQKYFVKQGLDVTRRDKALA